MFHSNNPYKDSIRQYSFDTDNLIGNFGNIADSLSMLSLGGCNTLLRGSL